MQLGPGIAKVRGQDVSHSLHRRPSTMTLQLTCPFRLVPAIVSLIVMSFTFATGALADKPEIYTGFGSNLAVGGYDTVAYFTDAEAVKGSKDFEMEFKGTKWRFSSQENLKAFEENPDAFRPQYGGYCAWAMARGDLAKGNPKFWRIVDDRLYLNINRSIQKKWEKDIPGFVEKANANWPGILAD